MIGRVTDLFSASLGDQQRIALEIRRLKWEYAKSDKALLQIQSMRDTTSQIPAVQNALIKAIDAQLQHLNLIREKIKELNKELKELQGNLENQPPVSPNIVSPNI